MTEIARSAPMGATVMETSVEDWREVYARPQCQEKVECYSRVVGFFRPVQCWNAGKKEEFKDRLEYVVR